MLVDARGGGGLTERASTERKHQFGIEGYRIPKHGIQDSVPKYSMPKDRLQNFLEQIKRHSKGIPSSSQYHKALSWKTSNGFFGKGAKRTTFTDEVARRSRHVPAPGAYSLKYDEKIPMGKSE